MRVNTCARVLRVRKLDLAHPHRKAPTMTRTRIATAAAILALVSFLAGVLAARSTAAGATEHRLADRVAAEVRAQADANLADPAGKWYERGGHTTSGRCTPTGASTMYCVIGFSDGRQVWGTVARDHAGAWNITDESDLHTTP